MVPLKRDLQSQTVYTPHLLPLYGCLLLYPIILSEPVPNALYGGAGAALTGTADRVGHMGMDRYSKLY